MASILDEQMQKRSSEQMTGQWITNQLGTVTARGVLLDKFPYELTNIKVNDSCTLDEPDMTNTESVGGGSGYAEFQSHSHPVITPKPILPLHIGDRVLVAPVNGGQEWVIICRIVPFKGGA